EYDPFCLANLKLSWKFRGWNISGSVQNLFNTSYYDYGNIPQPGRWWKLSVSKKIEFAGKGFQFP
nr:TonB-dependent receptor [Prolixibacteraceae bacterium]